MLPPSETELDVRMLCGGGSDVAVEEEGEEEERRGLKEGSATLLVLLVGVLLLLEVNNGDEEGGRLVFKGEGVVLVALMVSVFPKEKSEMKGFILVSLSLSKEKALLSGSLLLVLFE
jgi:hypothetical protein